MKLYHGTNRDFDKIDLLKSKPNKNFGRGFYLSAAYEQALNMAQVKVEQLEAGCPIVQSYLVDDDSLTDLCRYENHSIDLSTLVHNLQYMKGVTFQYFFGTERAIKLLKRI